MDLTRIVDELFDALLERAKHVLVALRDAPDDPEMVQRWAADNGLDNPRFIARTVEMRSWWTTHPRAAEHMRRYWHSGYASFREETDDEKKHRAALLSNPLTLPQGANP